MKRLALLLLLLPAAASAAQVEAPTFRAAQARFVGELAAGPVVPTAPQDLQARIGFLQATLEALPSFRLSDPAQLEDRSQMFALAARQLAALRQAEAGKPFDTRQLKGRLRDAQRAAAWLDDLSKRDAALSGAAAQARENFVAHQSELRAQLYPTKAALRRRMEDTSRRLGSTPEADGVPETPQAAKAPRLGPPAPPPPRRPSAVARVWRKPAVKVGASVAAAGAFDLFVLAHSGAQAASQFVSTYLIEWTMSLDNLVVIAGVLATVPRAARKKVLRLGLLGTALARLAMIAGGVKAVSAHPGLFVVFGVFLLFTALKILNPKLDLLARLKPSSAGGRWKSPVLAAALAVVLYDALFALDSVPAALAVSRSVFIVFSASLFAVLGLRSLFSVLEALERRFKHLNKGVAAVLVFVAAKLFGLPAGPLASLAVIVALLGAAMAASWRSNRRAS